MLHNVDQYITALQASVQYSDKSNITNETIVKQYGGVIDQHKNLIYIGNAIEFVSYEVCRYFYITIFQLFSIIGDTSIWYCNWLVYDNRH